MGLRCAILSAIGSAWSATDVTRVVFQTVADVFRRTGILRAGRIRISRHRVKRQRLDGVRQRFVKIHVFCKTVRVEEVITRPSRPDRSQRGRIEFEGYFVSGSNDDKLVVSGIQKRQYISIGGEIT